MGLLERLGLRKPKVNEVQEGSSLTPTEEFNNNKFSELIKQIREKAKKYGGDPFHEYRSKGLLPEKFEYGMNSLLDRVMEERGGIVAQKVYEELKEIQGGCTITTPANSIDIPGIPILFSIHDSAYFEAYIRAAEKLKTDKKVAFAIDKKKFIGLILEGTDAEITLYPHGPLKHINVILNSEPWLVKGVDCHKRNEYPEALKCYEKALEEEPLDARAWLNKGHILNKLKKYGEAIECCDRAIDIAPKLAEGGAWVHKASALRELKKYHEAIECYDKVLEINPNNYGMWNEKALVLVELKRYEEAVGCVNRAIELKPLDIGLYGNKGLFLFELGRYQEVIECFDKVLEIDPKCAGAWNEKGLAFVKLNKYKDGIECYDKALSISPGMDVAWLNRADALRKIKEYEKAVKSIDKAQEINPNTPSWETWNNLATNLTESGKHKKALDCIDKAIQLEPLDSRLWINKAAILNALNKYEMSEECCDRALEINPKLAGAWFNKGASLLMRARLEAGKGTKNIGADFVKYFKLASRLDPQMVNNHIAKELIKGVLDLENKDLGENYAYKLLTTSPKYFQKLEGETETQYARRLTVISLGFFNRMFSELQGGDPLEAERFQLYFEVVNKIMSDPFRNYENNPNSQIHFVIPNANYGLGRVVGKLLPSAEDPEFERILVILSDSILPALLPIVPDIKEESGEKLVFQEKFYSAFPVMVTKLHDKICTLRNTGTSFEERVWSSFNKSIIRKYIIEARIDTRIDLGEPVLRLLVEALRDENEDIRIRAANILWKIGEPAVGPLIEALRDENKDVWALSAYSLRKIGEPALGPVVEALRDENKDVRSRAAYILGEIGEPAIGPMIEALRDKNKDVRTSATYILGKIGEPAVGPVVEALRDENEDVRTRATYILGEIGEPAVGPMIEAFRDENWGLQTRVNCILSKIGEPAVGPLIEALGDENEKLRIRAADALFIIGEPAVRLLTGVLNHKNESVRQLASLCLKRIKSITEH